METDKTPYKPHVPVVSYTDLNGFDYVCKLESNAAIRQRDREIKRLDAKRKRYKAVAAVCAVIAAISVSVGACGSGESNTGNSIAALEEKYPDYIFTDSQAKMYAPLTDYYSVMEQISNELGLLNVTDGIWRNNKLDSGEDVFALMNPYEYERYLQYRRNPHASGPTKYEHRAIRIPEKIAESEPDSDE